MWRRLISLSAVVLAGVVTPLAAQAAQPTRFDWTGVVGDMQPKSSTVTVYVGSVAETILWTPSTQISGGTLAMLTPGTIVEIPGQFTSSANVATSIRILRAVSSTAKTKSTSVSGAIVRSASGGAWITVVTAAGRVDATTQTPAGVVPTLAVGQVVSLKGMQIGSSLSVSDASILPVPAPQRLKAKPLGNKSTVTAVVVAGQKDLWEMWTATGFVSVTLDPTVNITPTTLVAGVKVNVTGIATGSQLWATSVATASSDS